MRIAFFTLIVVTIAVCPAQAYYWGIFRAPIQWIATRLLSGSSGATDTESTSTVPTTAADQQQQQNTEPSTTDGHQRASFYQRFGDVADPEKNMTSTQTIINDISTATVDQQEPTQNQPGRTPKPEAQQQDTAEKSITTTSQYYSRLSDRYIAESTPVPNEQPFQTTMETTLPEFISISADQSTTEQSFPLTRKPSIDEQEEDEIDRSDESSGENFREYESSATTSGSLKTISLHDLVYGQFSTYPPMLRLSDDGELYAVNYN